jgi:GTP cyclohydrolase II
MSAHIVLTSHPRRDATVPEVRWGAPTPEERGPLVASLTNPAARNVIGSHSGAYAVYRALAVASGALQRDHRPDLTNTAPAETIGPHPQWGDPDKIVSLDPWGHLVSSAFADRIAAGLDVRPTIAITKAHINMPELQSAITAGRLQPDGEILFPNGDVRVTKAAIDPVWYLPGLAKRFGIKESTLRRSLFEQTAGMFPELVTRNDLKVFLPPIGGMTLYFFGDVAKLGRPETKVACRLHEVCIEMAQQGGVGLVVYNRKEGRALGEVTKFLVYNARKRQTGGDRAETYFERTECVAGVQDMRFQELTPDVFHWLGITRIDRWASMSNMKHGALTAAGIEVVERVPIPDELIPADARVEMDAKKAAGYFSHYTPDANELAVPKGRGLQE